MNERRRQLMAIHKDADMIDIEFELAIELQTHPWPLSFKEGKGEGKKTVKPLK